MRIEFDQSKRDNTLEARGLDMADAAEVFDGPHMTVEDDRIDYGEARFITIGFMSGRMVVLVWTERGRARRIISMRKANGREQKAYGPRFE
ncbi:BrnT family toxin [Rhodovulum sulfidophilum]|uniref:BrnT family toxin n=1 Tax=Rhodovulum sulfidophilum TaxID=35806 RepID=A0ABS1RWN3_RHOSU|nr:BrnT family toxin [Rhodovulum sulfidophilum]MBL3554556.1 BrnT family toxin [Rhodovulum sulfidophilum]MBL3565428.1 BrnT family toxin [Rhodovulum sulfidophilum]MBL3576414.1 BrnT family toxin [Rhodovulum sulfidophilum]MBL3610073.1 BrnT family toxin [Rhodovulum sulfidophilum]MCE8433867.1 BrnT family toxin [Rhodovulum sulfidophilum]